MSIDTAPKDGRQFLALQDGEVYQAKYFIRDKAELAFRTHALHIASHHRVIDAEMDGKPVKAHVPIGEPWPEQFQHSWTFWTRGFDFKPTHWMPLTVEARSSLGEAQS
jgi:hypothetical protein